MNLSPINSSNNKQFELVIFRISILHTGRLVVSPGYRAYPHGYGHPSFRWGGRYVVMDMYVKEARRWSRNHDKGRSDGGVRIPSAEKDCKDYIPLLLVDILLQKEKIISMARIIIIRIFFCSRYLSIHASIPFI